MTQVSDQVGPSGGDSFAIGIAQESERLAGKAFVVVFVERWLDPDGLTEWLSIVDGYENADDAIQSAETVLEKARAAFTAKNEAENLDWQQDPEWRGPQPYQAFAGKQLRHYHSVRFSHPPAGFYRMYFEVVVLEISGELQALKVIRDGMPAFSGELDNWLSQVGKGNQPTNGVVWQT